MKKRVLTLICALVFALLLPVSVMSSAIDSSTVFVSDGAALLESDELQTLQDECSAISLNNDFTCAIVTVTDMNTDAFPGSGTYSDVSDFAAAYYTYMGYPADGLMFAVDKTLNTYTLYYTGKGKDLMAGSAYDNIYDDFASADSWYDGFESFVQNVSDLLPSTASGDDNILYAAAGSEAASSAYANASDLPHVIDDAGLLSSGEIASLESSISSIRSKYDFDVVILTTNNRSSGKYVLNGRTSYAGDSGIEAFADDYYDYMGYGMGSGRDGMIFVVDMGDRSYWTSTSGYGLTAFTDYGVEQINSAAADKLKDGNYDEAFTVYLKLAAKFLDAAKAGKPYDVGHTYNTPSYIAAVVVIIMLVALLIAFLIMRSMKAKMNTAVKAESAADYLRPGSLNVTQSRDVFMYSNVVRTAIPKQSSGGGGGGSSSHTSSSGSSHGGGGGHF